MAGLTNKYLEELTTKFAGKNFLGVFPSDAIPQSKKKTFAIIFNLSKHYEAGSHFVAIIKNPQKIIYFDSFGRKCSNQSIQSFMEQFKIPIFYNIKKIQHYSSNFCGFYCFYFVYYCFYLKNSLSSFLRLFPKNVMKKNDSLLVSYIVKSITKH